VPEVAGTSSGLSLWRVLVLAEPLGSATREYVDSCIFMSIHVLSFSTPCNSYSRNDVVKHQKTRLSVARIHIVELSYNVERARKSVNYTSS
jgi:hypothetical protein